jgi:hypothetical protein
VSKKKNHILLLIQIWVLIFVYMNLQVCSHVHLLLAATRAQDSTMSAGFVDNYHIYLMFRD